MKAKTFAFITIFTTIVAVTANTVYLNHEIERFITAVSSLDIEEGSALAEAQELREDFLKSEAFISLTLSHDDLTNIEESFSEIIGYLSVRDFDGAKVTKNRLIDSLEHLKRLSGFNIDAII